MRNLKYFLGLLLLLMAFGMGWWVNQGMHKQVKPEVQAHVALGMLRNVLKLATVEQEISEVLTRRQFRSYDWEVFSGRMIYKVHGKVAAGYDFEGLSIVVDSLNKKVTISGLNEAELLYVDADVQFYDIDEGLFFEFAEEDYNQVMHIGRQELIKAAKENGILNQAHKQGMEALDHLHKVLFSVGWELDVVPHKRLPGFLKETRPE